VMPCPLSPWHLAQWVAKTVCPASASWPAVVTVGVGVEVVVAVDFCPPQAVISPLTITTSVRTAIETNLTISFTLL
jgi:hypothetical protein